MTKTVEKKRYTVTEAQELLGVSNKTVHNWITSGTLDAELQHAPVPYYLITEESLQAALKEQTKERDQSAN